MSAVTLDDVAREYFASLSGLAGKLQQDCDAVRSLYGEEWEKLSWDKQDELLDEHLIDRRVVDRYASLNTAADSLPSCFPVLKINCGEKIIVDFEHEDGWTWTDEHSAPFSWRSRSQQDLTLDDLFNTKEERKKKGHSGTRSRSPELIRSPLGAGLGSDMSDKNEVERMFERFGLKGRDDDSSTDVSKIAGGLLSSDEVDSPSRLYNEKSKLLTAESDVLIANGLIHSDDKHKVLQSKENVRSRSKEKGKKAKEETASKLRQSGNTSNWSSINEDKDVKTRKSQLEDAEKRPDESKSKDQIGYGGTVNEAMASDAMDEYIELEDVGESCTDDVGGRGVGASGRGSVRSDVVTVQPRSFSSTAAPVPAESAISQHEEEDSEASQTAVKTGFDFLDNW